MSIKMDSNIATSESPIPNNQGISIPSAISNITHKCLHSIRQALTENLTSFNLVAKSESLMKNDQEISSPSKCISPASSNASMYTASQSFITVISRVNLEQPLSEGSDGLSSDANSSESPTEKTQRTSPPSDISNVSYTSSEIMQQYEDSALSTKLTTFEDRLKSTTENDQEDSSPSDILNETFTCSKPMESSPNATIHTSLTSFQGILKSSTETGSLVNLAQNGEQEELQKEMVPQITTPSRTSSKPIPDTSSHLDVSSFEHSLRGGSTSTSKPLSCSTETISILQTSKSQTLQITTATCAEISTPKLNLSPNSFNSNTDTVTNEQLSVSKVTLKSENMIQKCKLADKSKSTGPSQALNCSKSKGLTTSKTHCQATTTKGSISKVASKSKRILQTHLMTNECTSPSLSSKKNNLNTVIKNDKASKPTISNVSSTGKITVKPSISADKLKSPTISITLVSPQNKNVNKSVKCTKINTTKVLVSNGTPRIIKPSTTPVHPDKSKSPTLSPSMLSSRNKTLITSTKYDKVYTQKTPVSKITPRATKTLQTSTVTDNSKSSSLSPASLASQNKILKTQIEHGKVVTSKASVSNIKPKTKMIQQTPVLTDKSKSLKLSPSSGNLHNNCLKTPLKHEKTAFANSENTKLKTPLKYNKITLPQISFSKVSPGKTVTSNFPIPSPDKVNSLSKSMKTPINYEKTQTPKVPVSKITFRARNTLKTSDLVVKCKSLTFSPDLKATTLSSKEKPVSKTNKILKDSVSQPKISPKVLKEVTTTKTNKLIANPVSSKTKENKSSTVSTTGKIPTMNRRPLDRKENMVNKTNLLSSSTTNIPTKNK